MKLNSPFIQLPLQFDAASLAREIDNLGESVWLPHPQGFAGNSMLPLIAVDGDPSNESFSGRMRETQYLLKCPYLMQCIASLGVVAGRTRLMRLSGNAEVSRHADQGYYWAERMRVHVPITTQASVRFECGDAAVHMAAGECWIFDTWRQHRVLNPSNFMRVHLVVDTVGGIDFWNLVDRGRPYSNGKDTWHPDLAFAEIETVNKISLELMNVPNVMTPWEMKSQFGLLFADAIPHPHLADVQMSAAKLVRNWRALWAQFGDSSAARDKYQSELNRFLEEIKGRSESLILRNGLNWHGAMATLVTAPALGLELPQTVL